MEFEYTLPYNHPSILQVKSKYLAEYRRFSLQTNKDTYLTLINQIHYLHKLSNIETVVTYTDPIHGDLLPINNDENFAKALQSVYSTGILRIDVLRKDNYVVTNGFGTISRKKGKKKPTISLPQDFRPVSAIIDVDILPETLRRVRLHNHGANKPLGFFIRDGVSLHMSENGVDRIPGIFISRLVQGGLAEMTGLLAVNDEVIEVNGIEVAGKSLDQVTDMMVANSSNLIVTVKPASMRNISGTIRSKSSTGNRLPIPTRFESDVVEGVDDEGDDDIQDIYFNSPGQQPFYSSSTSNPSLSKSNPLQRSSEVLGSVDSGKSSVSSYKSTNLKKSQSNHGTDVVNL